MTHREKYIQRLKDRIENPEDEYDYIPANKKLLASIEKMSDEEYEETYRNFAPVVRNLSSDFFQKIGDHLKDKSNEIQ